MPESPPEADGEAVGAASEGEQGCRPERAQAAATGIFALAAGLAAALLPAAPAAAAGFDTLSACAAWRSSHGTARILLGNAIGAENRLSKSRRFEESPPEAPVELYSVVDLRRVCDERR